MTEEKSKEVALKRDLQWGLTAEESEQRWEKKQQIKARAIIISEKQEKIISTLLQQCADEDLTITEVIELLLLAKSEIDKITSHAKVRLLHNH